MNVGPPSILGYTCTVVCNNFYSPATIFCDNRLAKLPGLLTQQYCCISLQAERCRCTCSKNWQYMIFISQCAMSLTSLLLVTSTRMLIVVQNLVFINCFLSLQDWEAYASSYYSLSQEMESLMHLVIHWRRLELR